MRLLGSVVLFMEALTTGFALLIIRTHHSSLTLIYGAVIAIALILTIGFLKSKVGWLLGSILQIGEISLGWKVTAMWFLGGLFAILWLCAYVIGSRGEALAANDYNKPRE